MSVLQQSTDEHGAVLAEINVTPFTDVLLVLLIIFMILASLAVPPGFERRFSNCMCLAPASRAPQPIPVTVTRAGAILIEGNAVRSVSALYPVLASMHVRAPHANVTLYADAKAPYGTVVRVLDAAKAGGIPNVSFVTQ